MSDYFHRYLNGERLRSCYACAPTMIQDALEAELDCILRDLRPEDRVLQLGCGYGRILPDLARRTSLVIGIDIALASLKLAHHAGRSLTNLHVLTMDAARLGFADRSMDRIICNLNCLPVFRVDVREMLRENLRVLRPGGTLIVSLVGRKMIQAHWNWLRRLESQGLIGPIRAPQANDGRISTLDGFEYQHISTRKLDDWITELGVDATIQELDSHHMYSLVGPS